MVKRILILGGFGFVGQNIYNVFFEDKDYNFKYIIHRESLRTNCDIQNIQQLVNAIIISDPDIIIFAAAHVGSVHYVTKYAADVINDNAEMYLNLYKAVAEVNPKIIIINLLANCSYPGIMEIQDEDFWWDGAVHESVEAYGNTKKFSYILSKCYEKQYGIKTINLMLPGCFGEYDSTDENKTHAMNGIIMRMIKAIKNNDKEFAVWGTGTPIREWIYAEDVGKIIKQIIDNEMYNLPNPINLGQEKGISIAEIAEMVKKSLNYDVNIVFDTTIQDGALIKVLGNRLFKKYFPDFVFTDYETAIKNTITYYKTLL